MAPKTRSKSPEELLDPNKITAAGLNRLGRVPKNGGYRTKESNSNAETSTEIRDDSPEPAPKKRLTARKPPAARKSPAAKNAATNGDPPALNKWQKAAATRKRNKEAKEAEAAAAAAQKQATIDSEDDASDDESPIPPRRRQPKTAQPTEPEAVTTSTEAKATKDPAAKASTAKASAAKAPAVKPANGRTAARKRPANASSSETSATRGPTKVTKQKASPPKQRTPSPRRERTFTPPKQRTPSPKNLRISCFDAGKFAYWLQKAIDGMTEDDDDEYEFLIEDLITTRGHLLKLRERGYARAGVELPALPSDDTEDDEDDVERTVVQSIETRPDVGGKGLPKK